MKIAQLKIYDSIAIIVIVVFASFAYYLTSTYLKKNLIQYSSLPKEINMKVYDELNKDSIVLKLPVISKLRIDSLPQFSKNNGLVNRLLLISNHRTDSLTHRDQTDALLRHNILFHQNPIFLVWSMLVSIMMAIAAGSFPVFVIQIFRLKNKFKLSSVQVLTGFIYAIIVVLSLALNSSELRGYYKPPDIINDLNILLSRGEILNNIVIFTTILSIPTFLVIFLTAISSDNLSIKNSAGKSIKKEDEIQKFTDVELVKQKKMEIEAIARQFEFLSQSLKGAMQILAVIVVFSVLTSSALRMSIKAVVEIKYYDIFPVEASYVYGMYFSLFLCIMYIPSYIYLKNRFMKFKENINMQLIDEQWSQSVLETVKFEGTALDNIKLAFTILAPLITSFLPDSLHLIK
jgi:hypothetical protein